MAAFVFNIGKGRSVELGLSGANFVVLLLEAAEAQVALEDYDSVQTLLAAAGNTEVAHGSYARKTGISATVIVDDTLDDVSVTIPDQTFPALAGNNPVKAIIAYQKSAGDANLIPLTAHDISSSTDGSDLVVLMP